MSRWIDADATKLAVIKATTYGDALRAVKEQPSIDIVRCKECKWWIDNLTENDDDEAYDSCRWDWSRKIPTADDFCSYGERTEQTGPQTDCAWK